MLSSLNFIKGSISAKTFMPELNHVQIKNNLITSFDGTMCLAAPLEDIPDMIPKATPFIKAIDTATKEEEEITLSLKKEKVCVSTSRFKAYIPCLTEWVPNVLENNGTLKNVEGSLLEVFKILSPFISQDASRNWSRGILFKGPFAYVTNNIILIQYYTGYKFFDEELIIPYKVIHEMLRIKEEPLMSQIDKNTFTFHYDEDRFLRSSKICDKWPNIKEFMDSCATEEYHAFPDNFFEVSEKLLPFLNESRSLYFKENGNVCTSKQEDDGVSFNIAYYSKMRFNCDMLLLLKNIATKINFSVYPEPCPFRGKNLRGVIVGMLYEV